MRLRGLPLFPVSAALLLTNLLAQQSGQELPSAPSATVQQQQQAQTPKPAPPPPPQPASEPPAEPAANPQIVNPGEQSTDQPAPPPPPPAQEEGPATDPAARIVTTVNEVNVVFTVSDKHGRFVKDLKKDDFAVLDDGRPAIRVRSFQRQTDLPLRVGLLVDASNSVRDRFKFEQESAIEFLNQTVRPRYDKAFVIGFDVAPEVTQDFTDNAEALSKGVRMLKPGGGTAMYDALYFACRDKLAKEARTGPQRRAIILLSDGDDNQSRVTREEAIEMAQRAEVIIYTISTNITGSANKGDKVLQRISDATGGRAFFPFQITEVANAFAEIQDELRSQYALSYQPAELTHDGRFRTIEIMAMNKKLKVRNRRGYFAPSR